MSIECSQQRAVGDVPELESVVFTSRDDEASVGGEGDRIDIILMSFQGFQQHAIGGVPELDRVVSASGDDEVSVGGEGDSLYRAAMTKLPHDRRTLRQDIVPLGARGSRRGLRPLG